MANLNQQAGEFLNYKGRLLNHLEMVHRPGERHLVTKLFTALGCTVIDTGCTHLGISVNPTEEFPRNNALYASEVTPEQWALEQLLQKALEGGSALSAAYAGYEEKFRRHPQMTSHFGIRYPSFDAVEEVVSHLQDNLDAELKGRVQLKGDFPPRGPGFLQRLGYAGFHQDRCCRQWAYHLRTAYRVTSSAQRRLIGSAVAVGSCGHDNSRVNHQDLPGHQRRVV